MLTACIKKRLGSLSSRLPRRSTQWYYCTPCGYSHDPPVMQFFFILQYFFRYFKMGNLFLLCTIFLWLLVTEWPVTRFAMHRNHAFAWFRAEILRFSVNFVHKKHLAERYQWIVTQVDKKITKILSKGWQRQWPVVIWCQYNSIVNILSADSYKLAERGNQVRNLSDPVTVTEERIS